MQQEIEKTSLSLLNVVFEHINKLLVQSEFNTDGGVFNEAGLRKSLTYFDKSSLFCSVSVASMKTC